MKQSSCSRPLFFKNPLSGMTLLELMGVMVIIGLLAWKAVPKIQEIIERGRDTKAQDIQNNLNDWYASWVMAGGTHNATTPNEGSMAYYLITSVAGTDASDAGIGKAPDSDGNYVDETRLAVKGKSLAGALRMDFKGAPIVLDSATNKVLFDGGWEISFHPSGTNKGSFLVEYRRN